MGTEKLDTEVRQEQLAQAALSLITTQGLKGLSVARVARRVGLVPSAVYRHFESKDELLDAVLELIRERLNANVVQASQDGTDALQILRRLVMAHVRLIRENEGILSVVFSDEVHNGRPERKARVHSIIQGYLRKVAQIVSRGQQQGHIRPDADPGTVSVMFLGLIQPAALLWHLSDGGFDVTRHVERAWDLLSKSLRAS
ncbi:MAG: TetR/AcrR family transcriptional regulator [Candidatus Solibacter sp.]|jgi:AcrR family transcriptional regulator